MDKKVSDKFISINYNDFPLSKVSDYKVYNTKTYVTSPLRSNDGSIGNINDYDVFFVPRIIISFNFISFEDYVFLNDIINSSNEYYIWYFDHNANRMVGDYFYLTPEESEKLLYVDGSIKGIQNLTLSFVGTLTRQKTSSIRFTDTTGAWLKTKTTPFGERVQISELFEPDGLDTDYDNYWEDTDTGVRYYWDSYIIPHKTKFNFKWVIE